MNIVNQKNKLIFEEFEKLVKQIEHDIDVAPTKKAGITNRYRLKQIKNVLKIISKYDKEIKSGEQLEGIKGVGKGSIERINEILKKGKLSEIKLGEKLEMMDKQIEELQQIIGIGRKTAHDLVTIHGIKSIDELKSAQKSGKIELNDNILMGLKYHGVYQQSIPRTEMIKLDTHLHLIANEVDYKILIVICGSYRRLQLTSNDIDCMIVHPEVSTKNDIKIKTNYLNMLVKKLIDKKFIVDSLTSPESVTKYMGFCQLGKKYPVRRIDIRYIPYKSYYTALLYFTGSGEFNQKMRTLAIGLGYTLNEYGLYKVQDDKSLKKIKITSEEQIFKILGMEYVPPENRK